MYYQIADLIYNIEYMGGSPLQRFEKYSCKSELADSQIIIQKRELLTPAKGKSVLKEDALWYRDSEKQTVEIYQGEHMLGQMVSSLDWSSVEIFYSDNDVYNGYSVSEFLLAIQHRNRLIHHNGLVIHSSAIKYNNQGLIFSAPSGTGKTTHTTLWEKNRNACVINDDAPAIRMLGDDVYMYGTPWSGSSQKFTSDKVPLKAIVLLKQAPENKMSLLKGSNAVVKLLPRVLLPYHDETLMLSAIDLVGNLIKKVPIYMLECTPDVAAMELVEKCLNL